ncbi:MAG: aldehyde ferredoxin oxidoreductase N-terminal domain-containing protein [Acidobacteriota bacterium]
MLNSDHARVLHIDLNEQSWHFDERRDLLPYLGGVGIGIRLLDEHTVYDKDPFFPDQPIIFCIGPLSAVFPVMTKVVCMFRSPLTGELGESYAGGRLAMAMVYAGLDAIVIKGESRSPVYLSIGPDSVEFHNAEPLWGVGTEETGRYLREIEPGRGFRSIVRIGPAGENLVHFASLNVDTFRHFGRLGSGAVFGSKNLKAMVVHGDENYPIPNDRFKDFRKVYAKIHKTVTETDVMRKYRDLGTPINVKRLNAMNSLPTRNLQQGTFENAEELSGEAFADEVLSRKLSCTGCPVGCIHIATHRKPGNWDHEVETSQLAYDHELIFALGSFLDTQNKADFMELLEDVEDLGFDVMSVGVLLGWITEAFTNGLIPEQELGTRVEFGYKEGYLEVMRRLARPNNDLYRTLAKGTEFAAQTLGGLDYALTLGKTEMTGYHTGYGAALGQAVGARHSHLDNGGYSFDQSRDYEDLPGFVASIMEEELNRCVTNCMIMCLFARSVYDYPILIEALNSVGIEKTEDELKELGREVYRNKIAVKQKMGFEFKELRFPKRFFETKCMHGELNEETMQHMLDLFTAEVDRVMGQWAGPGQYAAQHEFKPEDAHLQ